MATHSKKVDVSVGLPYQVFTNDTSVTLTGAVVFADGDYIDFTASLGRPAKSVMIILNGIVDIVLQFNVRLKASKPNLTEADSAITMPEAMAMVNPIRLFSGAGESSTFTFPSEFGIDILKIVDYTGTASAVNNLTIIGF